VNSRVGFHPDAKREMREATDFYDLERSGLGTEFLDAIEGAMQRVIEHPESSPIVLGRVRSLPLPLRGGLLGTQRWHLRLGDRAQQSPTVLLARQALDC
jgi:hypothetical protein